MIDVKHKLQLTELEQARRFIRAADALTEQEKRALRMLMDSCLLRQYARTASFSRA